MLVERTFRLRDVLSFHWVEISNLMKTGSGDAESSSFGGRGCARDGSGAHRIGLWARLTARAGLPRSSAGWAGL